MKTNLKNKIIRINKNSLVSTEKLYKLSSVNHWYNSIYCFDKNFLINIDKKDKISNIILTSYFNSVPEILYKEKIKRTRMSLKRIFISKSEIKHNIDNIIITIYSFNKQKKVFLNNISRVNRMFFKPKIYKIFINRLKKNFRSWRYLSIFVYKGIISNVFKLQNKKINLFFYYIQKIITQYNSKRKKFLITILLKNIIKGQFKNIYLYQYYATMLYINNIKFQKNNMLNMLNILSILYNKKVILNIINLKYLFMDNSLILDGIVRQVRDRRKNVLNVIRYAIGMSRKCVLDAWLLIPNVYKDIANEYLDFRNNNVIDYIDYKIADLNICKYNILDYTYNNNKNYIFKYLKYKFFRGINIQAKGRLTHRLTASRAVTKLAQKGSLQNIYTRSQGLSSMLIRNNYNYSLQYLNVNSYNRNGSFGIRSWTNSY